MLIKTCRPLRYILLFLLTALLPAHVAFAQTFCNDFGNMVIYSNYEGGILNIDIDQPLNNLKVGISTYEAVEVNFSGLYVGDIVAVIYAGFGGTDNNNCGGAPIAQVNINGVSPDIVTIYSQTTSNIALSPYLGHHPSLRPMEWHV